MSPLRTLFVSPQVPWPLDVGSKIRVHNLLGAYSSLGPVTLVCLAQGPAEARNVAAIAPMVERVHSFDLPPAVTGGGKMGAISEALNPTPRSLRYFRSPSLAAKVQSLLATGSFDVLHVERLYMADNVQLRATGNGHGPRPLRILDLDDLESSRMKRTASVESWLAPAKYVHGLEWGKLYATEQKRLPTFDCALVCSEKDRAIVQQRHRGVKVEVFANGADLPADAPPPVRGDDGRTVVFLGAMDYQPNEDAVLFFVESVVPRLRERVPGFRFVVAGKSPSARVRALDNGRDVSVTGYVEDKAALFASTTVFVVPIRIGGGTRIKILEAMAAGIPVVSTRVGAEGIDAVGEESILLADSPDEFAAACEGLLLDAARRVRLGDAGRRLVSERYRWDQIRNRYAETVTRLAVGRTAK